MSQVFKFDFVDHERALEGNDKEVKEKVFFLLAFFSVAQEREAYGETNLHIT